MNAISETIKIERKKIGLTQAQFASQSGLGLRFVKELEQGKETVRLDKVCQALNYLGLTVSTEKIEYDKKHINTPDAVIISQMHDICKKHKVKHLYLFGSRAKGTQTEVSDFDFAICGFNGNIDDILVEVEEIRTLKEIDVIEYDKIRNKYLKEEIDHYGRKIY